MEINEATRQFIREHTNDDVRLLALQAHALSEVDLPFALDQIRGRQIARRKLPTWAAIDDILYPPHLSMEQCSSEQTARYKAQIAARLFASKGEGSLLVDLTGGFGVDFVFMQEFFNKAIYVEQNPQLFAISSENFASLGLQVKTINADSVEVLQTLPRASLLYLDPARRNDYGGRTYGIADCTPNVLELRDELLDKADYVLLKLSPMLDWRKAVGDLGTNCVSEVHIVSVQNECKELLLLLQKPNNLLHDYSSLTLFCVNDQQVFSVVAEKMEVWGSAGVESFATPKVGQYLYEPNASLMKAGCFGALCEQFGFAPVGPNSHLFVQSDKATKLQNNEEAKTPSTDVQGFPGRKFQILAISSMNKRSLRQHLGGITQANIATRNFPMKPEELRRRLKLRDGGDTYIFGTTLADGSHVILVCKKVVE